MLPNKPQQAYQPFWTKKPAKVYNLLPGGGEQERTRRRKQIEEGRLTTANGLEQKDV